jgi:site-specific DNA-cytosine methylase
MKNGINVLSCFDGLGGGIEALKRAGIKINQYYAFEIDKYAIKIALKNHPEIIELGDINDWQNHMEIEMPDLIIAGSPCQGFSVAGKGLNFDDPRSKLFFVFVDILNYWKNINQNLKFMLENVRMKKEWRDVITEYMDVEPVEINSALVSAQSRKRLYWANWEFGQPEDRGLILADILEDGDVDREKSYCLDANYHKGGNKKSYFEKGRRQLVRVGTASDIKGHDSVKRIYSSEGNIKFPNDVNVKSQTLLANGQSISRSTTYIENKGLYRKLTPLECERLQTLPDGYSEGVSNTQRYKMIGNGWTIEVIRHIFSYLPREFYTE